MISAFHLFTVCSENTVVCSVVDVITDCCLFDSKEKVACTTGSATSGHLVQASIMLSH